MHAADERATFVASFAVVGMFFIIFGTIEQLLPLIFLDFSFCIYIFTIYIQAGFIFMALDEDLCGLLENFTNKMNEI